MAYAPHEQPLNEVKYALTCCPRSAANQLFKPIYFSAMLNQVQSVVMSALSSNSAWLVRKWHFCQHCLEINGDE